MALTILDKTQVSGTIIQLVTKTSNVGVSTTSSTFFSTNLSQSFTPLSPTSKIVIWVSGSHGTARADANGAPLTLFRDATNLGAGGAGVQDCFAIFSSGTANEQRTETAAFVVEEPSPGAGVAVTYTVKIKTEASPTVASLFGIYGWQMMVIMEVA